MKKINLLIILVLIISSPLYASTKKPFLKNKVTERTKFWMSYFIKKDRARFQRFINNGEKYRHHIEEIFSSYGLPKDLYYVGLIESGYYLRARSHAKAVGPWQFIPGTGRRYGLKISSEIDERQDLFKATHAAAQYFSGLYKVFSSWELALCAYNAGEFGLMRRIVKYKTRDFYVLSRRRKLHPETINYVPKVLAAMHIIKNAKKYGFSIPEGENRIFDDTELRAVKKNLSLAKIAKRMNIGVSKLRLLNPELKTSKTPNRFAGTYYLRVPMGFGKNHYPTRKESRKETLRRTATVKTRPIIYKVRSGDNLHGIAQLFDKKLSQIKKVNKLKSGRIYAGQKIILPNTTRGVYTVKRGDHLTKISQKFNQPLEAILKLNMLNRKKIYPEQKLIVDFE